MKYCAKFLIVRNRAQSRFRRYTYKAMKCFGFSYSDKKNETPAKTPTKSIVQFGSGLNSQNVSDFPSFSRSSNLRVFTFNELKAATKNFRSSAQIGDGGFGCVYMGVIKNPRDSTKSKRLDVAVKQLRTESQGHKEWVTEVNVLGVVEHPNLVKLVGYCAEEDERGIRIQRLLVYEYMPNRSVEDHLSSRSEAPLSWPMRLKVAQDAARGLAYLHEELDSEIIFRNFKSSNILLDDQWNVKLSGFGEYPVVPDGECCVFSLSARVYVAPETFESGHISSKSDVWSYGVFLYELITGRRTFYRHVPAGEHHHLLHWVYKKKVQHIIDPRLKGTCPVKSAFALVNIANLCLNNLPSKRPKMSEVLELVNAVIGALSQPNSPAERGD